MKTLIASAFTTLLVASASAHALTSADLYGGAPAGPTGVERTIVIDGNTKYVNVVRGEIADLIIKGKSINWEFDGTQDVFPLNDALPAGTLDHTVMVYVDSRKGAKP